MILDGADNQETLDQVYKISINQDGERKTRKKTIMEYLPGGRSGYILITTRSRSMAVQMVQKSERYAEEQVLNVPPLTTEEGVSLLRKFIRPERCDDRMASMFVEEVRGSPLAINQAATYIVDHGDNVTTLDQFRNLPAPKPDLFGKQSRAVTSEAEMEKLVPSAVQTWYTSFEYIRQKYPDSASLLTVLVMFELHTVPFFILDDWHKNADVFKKAISVLVRFAMITISIDQAFVRIDERVHLYTRLWLATLEEEKCSAVSTMLRLLSDVPGTSPDEMALIHPYAVRALRQKPASNLDRNRASLLFNVAAYRKHLRKYDDAVDRLKECLDMRKRSHCDESVIKVTKKSLANVLQLQQKQKAKKSPTIVPPPTSHLPGRSKGGEAPKLLPSKTELLPNFGKPEDEVFEPPPDGQILGEGSFPSQSTDARSRWNKALGKSKESTPVPSPAGAPKPAPARAQDLPPVGVSKVAPARAPKLAQVVTEVQKELKNAQRFLDEECNGKAESICKQMLERFEKELGENDAEVVRLIDCLASVYHSQGQLKQALLQRQRVLDWCKANPAPKQANTVQQVFNLALLYDHQGEYAKAEKLYQQTLQKTRKYQGKGNGDVNESRILSSLATIYDLQGQDDKARVYFRDAYKLQKKLLGPEDRETMLTLHNFAIFLQHRGNFLGAEQLLLWILKVQASRLGDDHSDTLRTACNLALNHHLKGDNESAAMLYHCALSAQTEKFGRIHLDTLFTIQLLGELCEARGLKSEAQEHYKEAFEGRKALLGESHQETQYTKQKLVNLNGH